MQPILVLPVANGVLPRPQGGRITGMFLMEYGGDILQQVGVGQEILACSWNMDDASLYPVGVIARIVDISEQLAKSDTDEPIKVLLVTLEGRGHARWNTLRAAGKYIFSTDVQFMNLKAIRQEYPAVSGAGWQASGGYTEFRDSSDIPVVIYGNDLETGGEVQISANLGGLVSQEQAHTIEHAMIRALNTCGLCTARTLLAAFHQETTELKQSVEASIRFTLPELLGRTSNGACGNVMTNLAQFHLAQEFVDNIEAGKSLDESLTEARRATMAQLTGELGLTMQPGLRVLQGLKKGMSHDDTPLKINICKKVIGRFPLDPWG